MKKFIRLKKEHEDTNPTFAGVIFDATFHQQKIGYVYTDNKYYLDPIYIPPDTKNRAERLRTSIPSGYYSEHIILKYFEDVTDIQLTIF